MDEKKEILTKLGEFIKHKRIILGISAYQIEKEHKIDRAMWSKLESGKLPSFPKPDFLMKVSSILEINCIELYLILGYLTKENMMEYMFNANRVREKDRKNGGEKP